MAHYDPAMERDVDNIAPPSHEEKKNDNNRDDNRNNNDARDDRKDDRKEGEEIIPNCTWFINQYQIIGADGDTQAIDSLHAGVSLPIQDIGVPREYKDCFEIKQLGTYDMGTEDGQDGEVTMRALVKVGDGTSQWQFLQIREACNNGDYWLDIVDRVLTEQVYQDAMDTGFVAIVRSLKDATENVCI